METKDSITLQFSRNSEFPSAFRVRKIENYLANNFLYDFNVCKEKLKLETAERLNIYYSYTILFICILTILLFLNVFAFLFNISTMITILNHLIGFMLLLSLLLFKIISKTKNNFQITYDILDFIEK